MNCITKEDMKFGEYFIPARTKARVINTPQYHEAGIPGLQLLIAITLFDMQLEAKRMTGVPMSKTRINNELEKTCFGDTRSQMQGIVIYTHGDKVFLDAGDEFYSRSTLSKWHVQKIVGEVIPENIAKAEYSSGYSLESVIEYLENEFTEWVGENCDLKILTEEDIENGEGIDGSDPGDSVLSEIGLLQFYEKQLEYQQRLETSGFTYDFKGGLIWE